MRCNSLDESRTHILREGGWAAPAIDRTRRPELHNAPAPATAARTFTLDLKQSSDSLGGILLHSSLGVGESHVEFLGASDDLLALAGAQVVSELSAVGCVVHEQQFNVFLVLDKKLSEATGQHVSGLSGLLLANVGAGQLTTELAAHGVVNTAGSSPGGLNTHKSASTYCTHSCGPPRF